MLWADDLPMVSDIAFFHKIVLHRFDAPRAYGLGSGLVEHSQKCLIPRLDGAILSFEWGPVRNSLREAVVVIR